MCWVYRYLKCVIILFVTFNCSCLCNKTDKGEQTTIKKETSPISVLRNPENNHYVEHIKKLKELEAFKPHNLNVEDNKKNAYIYINNPVESSLSKTYLTIEEFKKHLIEAHSKNTLVRNKIKHEAFPSSTIRPKVKIGEILLSEKIFSVMKTKNMSKTKENIRTQSIKAKAKIENTSKINTQSVKTRIKPKNILNTNTQNNIARMKPENISESNTKNIETTIKPENISENISESNTKNIETTIKPENISENISESNTKNIETTIKPENISENISESNTKNIETTIKSDNISEKITQSIEAGMNPENISITEVNVESIEALTKPITITPDNLINETEIEETTNTYSNINNTTIHQQDNTTPSPQSNITIEQDNSSIDVTTKIEQETTTKLLEEEYYDDEEEEEEEEEDIVKTTKKIVRTKKKIAPRTRPRPFVFFGN